MRHVTLGLLALAIALAFGVYRRNRRTTPVPWWAREYGRMNEEWVRRTRGGRR